MLLTLQYSHSPWIVPPVLQIRPAGQRPVWVWQSSCFVDARPWHKVLEFPSPGLFWPAHTVSDGHPHSFASTVRQISWLTPHPTLATFWHNVVRLPSPSLHRITDGHPRVTEGHSPSVRLNILLQRNITSGLDWIPVSGSCTTCIDLKRISANAWLIRAEVNTVKVSVCKRIIIKKHCMKKLEMTN